MRMHKKRQCPTHRRFVCLVSSRLGWMLERVIVINQNPPVTRANLLAQNAPTLAAFAEFQGVSRLVSVVVEPQTKLDRQAGVSVPHEIVERHAGLIFEFPA